VARHARCHEPGTRLFAVLRDQERPGRFLCTAVFDDADAAREHRSSPAALRLAALLLASGAQVRPARWSAIAGI
jgi:quinol monooxygenase YgiN